MKAQRETRGQMGFVALLSMCLIASDLSAATGSQVGPLFFDPDGADFSGWIAHFKDQVSEHWPPIGMRAGSHGRVAMKFTVSRGGALLRMRVTKATGTKELRKAAEDALSRSTFLALPRDYKRDTIGMDVLLYFNEELPSLPPTPSVSK